MGTLSKIPALSGLVKHKNRLETKINEVRYLSKSPEDHYCIGCNRHWKSFKPLSAVLYRSLKNAGWKYELEDAETLNFKNYTCYGCGINDRDRLYLIYLEKNLNKNEKYNVVEFAPSPALALFFKKYPNLHHRTSDLFMKNVDDKMDLQDLILYEDEKFDIFICSHILEHVADDNKAIRELYRITKKGGYGIAMVPIIDGLEKTHEDPTIEDPNLRMKYFGQDDHVRLYSKSDFVKRLENAGFKVKTLGAEYFGTEVFNKNGIALKSVLYIAEKS